VMRRRRTSKLSLVVLIIVLALCIWLLYRLFIGLPPAPSPVVRTAWLGWDRSDRSDAMARGEGAAGMSAGHALRRAGQGCGETGTDVASPRLRGRPARGT
jgi:hypothetical protein